MLAEAIVLIPKSANKGTEIQMDVLPLVLCTDCKWWHESETHKGYGDCGQANGITLKSSDWYCADGERQEGRWE